MKNSTKNIFFIENAFIYINALELREKLKFTKENCILVIQTYRTKNLRQLLKTIDTQIWDEIHYLFFQESKLDNLDLNSDSNSKFGFFKLLYFYVKAFLKQKRIIKRYKELNSIINGIYKDNLVSNFANRVQYKEYYHLDDGNMTLFVNEKIRVFENEHNFEISFFEGNLKERLFRVILEKFLSFRLKPIKEIIYFTSHNLLEKSYDRYLYNRYELIKENLSTKPLAEKCVFFLGGPLVEIEVCDEKDYFLLIERVLAEFIEKEVIYLPHRFEQTNRLNILREKFGLTILKHDMPIELFLKFNTFLPSTIASFYSSALGNLNVILPSKVNIKAFEIKNIMIIPKNKKIMISKIYDRYRTLESKSDRFKVIDFETTS